VSSIRQKTTLKKTVAENFCTLMKAAHLSNFNLVMQISPCLQNTASQTELMKLKRQNQLRAFPAKNYSDEQYI